MAEHCAGEPRYFVGRRVYAGSHRGTVVAMGTDLCAVAIDGAGRTEVPMSAIVNMNQRHVFPTTAGGKTMLLEDGLRADFSSPLMKAKVAECALALEEDMVRIGKALERQNYDAVVKAQCTAVRKIRRCLDITTFQRSGGGRGRDRFRYAKDDVAKMV